MPTFVRCNRLKTVEEGETGAFFREGSGGLAIVNKSSGNERLRVDRELSR